MSTCRTCGYKKLPSQDDSSQKKVGTSVNPADLITKPLPKPKTEQLMNLMGYEFKEIEAEVPRYR